jgi:hypothetical protein
MGADGEEILATTGILAITLDLATTGEMAITGIGITEAVIGSMMRAEAYLAEKDTVAAKAAGIPASEAVDTVAEEDSAAVIVAVEAAVMAVDNRGEMAGLTGWFFLGGGGGGAPGGLDWMSLRARARAD